MKNIGIVKVKECKTGYLFPFTCHIKKGMFSISFFLWVKTKDFPQITWGVFMFNWEKRKKLQLYILGFDIIDKKVKE